MLKNLIFWLHQKSAFNRLRNTVLILTALIMSSSLTILESKKCSILKNPGNVNKRKEIYYACSLISPIINSAEYLNKGALYTSNIILGSLKLRSFSPELLPVLSRRPKARARFIDKEAGMTFNLDLKDNKSEGYFITSLLHKKNQGGQKIQIWDLKNKSKLYEYDLNSINFNSLYKKSNRNIDSSSATVISNPVVTSDGNLVFLAFTTDNKYSAVVKIDKCSNIINFNNDFLYHHSLEVDTDGSVYVPIRKPPKDKKYALVPDYLNEGFAILNSSLETRKAYSLIEIFRKSNNSHYLYSQGGKYNNDPFHLNDVHPLTLKDGRKIVYLSLRSPSMLMAYDLANEHVIWQLNGLTSLQHDITPISKDGNSITVFDNNISSIPYSKNSNFLRSDSYNRFIKISGLPNKRDLVSTSQIFYNPITIKDSNLEFMVYDFKLLPSKDRPRTISSGSGSINSNHDSIFIEESNYGRAFEYNIITNSFNWEYHNKDKKSQNMLMFYNTKMDDLPISKEEFHNLTCNLLIKKND